VRCPAVRDLVEHPVQCVGTVGFSWGATFKFTGASAIIASDTFGKIKVTVPAGATTGKIKVVTPGGTAKTVTSFVVT